MKDTVLIVTNACDSSTEPVIGELEKMGQRFFRFNTETFPLYASLILGLKSGELTGSVAGEGEESAINLGAVKSVWCRRPRKTLIPENLASYGKFIQDEAGVCLWSLYTTLDALWVNPPLTSSRLLEHNKLYQLWVATRVGLRVPKTIVTNEPDGLISFCEDCGGRIAVKLLKGNFFTRGESPVTLFVFTNVVATGDLVAHREDIKLAPVLAQEYIEKNLELRVTVVGSRIFACAIHSQDSAQTRIDWRNYDFEKVKHEPCELPPDIVIKLATLMANLGLIFGAIDMIVTPNGEYVFLEVNPSGQWLWIEQLTGMPISRAIAELLANPVKNSAT